MTYAPHVFEFSSVFLEALDEGLLDLGKSVRHAIYYHLEKRYQVKREDAPERLEAFHKALEGLFGLGANAVEKLIAKRLYGRLGLSFVEHEGWTLVDYVDNAKKVAGEKREETSEIKAEDQLEVRLNNLPRGVP